MRHATATSSDRPEGSTDVLTELARQGARQMLATALLVEAKTYVDERAHLLDEAGHRLVVRNGYLPERTILTGLGPVEVRQPRVLDRQADEKGPTRTFTSRILPPYLRKTRSLEAMIPWLYLKGISTGDFSEALAALLGPEAPGLSATTVVRLKQVWEEDFKSWSSRNLAAKRYVYLWVDGIHCNLRLEDGRPCILVVMGATPDGKKELVAIQDGERESDASWTELLVDLKRRGLKADPQLAIGDGALGFWKAVTKVFPKTAHQRCWVHKMANVLDKLPKREQPAAKQQLQQIWMASTRSDAIRAFDAFVDLHEVKHPKATECLAKDREALLKFYDFPAEHWKHIRTTNPIESTFATVRLRTTRTKGSGSRMACMTMVFKLVQAAELSWRMLDGAKWLKELMKGTKFTDGIKDAA